MSLLDAAKCIKQTHTLQFVAQCSIVLTGEGRGTEHQQTKSKDSKKGKRERDSPEKQIGSHEKSDGLREAIASAKETLKRALEDSGGMSGLLRVY